MADKEISIEEMKVFLKMLKKELIGVGHTIVINNIIDRLEKGEKYKAIVKDIESDFDNLHCTIMSNNSFKIIKQKYFPKPKTEIWERFINVDFPSGASFVVKMTVTKDKDGITMIRYEPGEKYGNKLEKGGET